MPKAKTIDRLEYTKSRSITYHYPPAPVQMVNAEYNKEQGALIEREPGVEICPECRTEIIHESGCVRCPACGWSRC